MDPEEAEKIERRKRAKKARKKAKKAAKKARKKQAKQKKAEAARKKAAKSSKEEKEEKEEVERQERFEKEISGLTSEDIFQLLSTYDMDFDVSKEELEELEVFIPWLKDQEWADSIFNADAADKTPSDEVIFTKKDNVCMMYLQLREANRADRWPKEFFKNDANKDPEFADIVTKDWKRFQTMFNNHIATMFHYSIAPTAEAGWKELNKQKFLLIQSPAYKEQEEPDSDTDDSSDDSSDDDSDDSDYDEEDEKKRWKVVIKKLLHHEMSKRGWYGSGIPINDEDSRKDIIKQVEKTNTSHYIKKTAEKSMGRFVGNKEKDDPKDYPLWSIAGWRHYDILQPFPKVSREHQPKGLSKQEVQEWVDQKLATKKQNETKATGLYLHQYKLTKWQNWRIKNKCLDYLLLDENEERYARYVGLKRKSFYDDFQRTEFLARLSYNGELKYKQMENKDWPTSIEKARAWDQEKLSVDHLVSGVASGGKRNRDNNTNDTTEDKKADSSASSGSKKAALEGKTGGPSQESSSGGDSDAQGTTD